MTLDETTRAANSQKISYGKYVFLNPSCNETRTTNKTYHIRVCKMCGEQFTPVRAKQGVCSALCRIKLNRARYYERSRKLLLDKQNEEWYNVVAGY